MTGMLRHVSARVVDLSDGAGNSCSTMAIAITVRDETASGTELSTLTLEGLTDRTTVREIIRARVYQEVTDFNHRAAVTFYGLVAPVDAEPVCENGGVKLKQSRQINWEEQFEKAIDGFCGNAFFVVVDDRQADDLDEEFLVGVETDISFVKLVPLVGG